MNKQAYLENIYNEAYQDELQKIAAGKESAIKKGLNVASEWIASAADKTGKGLAIGAKKVWTPVANPKTHWGYGANVAARAGIIGAPTATAAMVPVWTYKAGKKKGRGHK